ncbi:MAG: CPBP family intramembrane glutamic endopeptidase [Candidatus Bathyarchaeia archaeon]
MINWKVFWILLVASVFGSICIIPYTLSIQLDLLEELPIPLHMLLTLQLFQNVIMFAILIFFGLRLAGKVGLGAPILESWSRGEKVKPDFSAILGISILLGVLAVILTAVLDLSFYFMFPNEPIYTLKLPKAPAWQGFLASFYGAINEEILSRLFLMSLFMWIFLKIKKTKEGKPMELTIWLAIAVTAIIFGLLHLPSTAILIPITPFIIARAVILNGIAGTIFGWLFWKKGLESAMISHFIADIIIHGIFPFLT